MNQQTRRMILASALCAAGMGLSATAAGDSPFMDAVQVWNFADDAGLKAVGSVKTGLKLEDEEKAASLARGGDGTVAELDGGYFVADGPVKIDGKQMTLLVRARDPQGLWKGSLLARQAPGDPYANLLYGSLTDPKHIGFRERARMTIDGRSIKFLWRTDPLAERVVPEYLIEGHGNPYAVGRGSPTWMKARAGTPELAAELRDGALKVSSAPLELIGPDVWHDIAVRFKEHKLEMFIDGVLIDEEFPQGELRHFESPFLIGAGIDQGVLRSEFLGQIDHVALWDRALNDSEIAVLSGGQENVAKRRIEIEGAPVNMPQYWRPTGYNVFVGDAMPFYHAGTFHLFYLRDRKHCAQRWGIGGHPWGHVSSRDLVTWEHHPRALDITDQRENALGTGQFIYHQGQYYLYWINCGRRFPVAGAPEHLQSDNIYLATSTDCIHFQKQAEPWARIDYKSGGDINPIVRKAASGDRYYMYCPNGHHPADKPPHSSPPWLFESENLQSWMPIEHPDVADKFPKGWNSCATYHEWNGWYYFHTGATYWISRKPLEDASAQWTVNKLLDGCVVPEVAPFSGNRRIMVGFGQNSGGYGGEAVFRELVQHEDGTLGSKWPEEMILPTLSPLPLKIQPLRGEVTGDVSSLSLATKEPGALAMAFVDNVPQNARITLRVVPQPGAKAFGLCVRGQGDNAAGRELRFEPPLKRFRYAMATDGAKPSGKGFADLGDVSGLDKPFDLDVIVKDDIIDACIDNRRTFFHRNSDATGDRLFFFTQGGSVEFKDIVIRQLKEQE